MKFKECYKKISKQINFVYDNIESIYLYSANNTVRKLCCPCDINMDHLRPIPSMRTNMILEIRSKCQKEINYESMA